MKKYIVFAYQIEGNRGGYQDIHGFAENVGEITDLIGTAKSNALIQPNIIEVFDAEEDELILLFVLTPDGEWKQQTINK
ncbi:hypothetical protein FLW98_26815 [Raoultella planticola]|uniref:hypothetical protein n=1 Tax=Raoultella planticola TaxID=575 RepID=UPI0011545F53|nr:hypothetical protein [Raoultella planticola]TQN52820.1 hypothetical protein FLW98_26815 [Raoultella planticola]